MKKFCNDLRKHAAKIINYEKKDMIPLTKKEEKTIIIKKFVYELSGCGFESSCSHLNFRFRACFEEGAP